MPFPSPSTVTQSLCQPSALLLAQLRTLSLVFLITTTPATSVSSTSGSSTSGSSTSGSSTSGSSTSGSSTSGSSAEACDAKIPAFEVGFTGTAPNTSEQPLSGTETFVDWAKELEAAIAQQGYDYALRALRSSYRPALDQASTLLATVALETFTGDRPRLLQEALEILQPLNDTTQRDQRLGILSNRAIQHQEMELAIAAAESISNLELKLNHLSIVISHLRAAEAEDRAQQVEDQLYKILSHRLEYRAAVLSNIGLQQHTLERSRTIPQGQAQQSFERAIALIPDLPGTGSAPQRIELNALSKEDSNALSKARREVLLGLVSSDLIQAAKFEQAMGLIEQMEYPEARKLQIANQWAKVERYDQSLKLATQIENRTAVPELETLVQTFLLKGQLNCALQVTFSPVVNDLALEQIVPTLVFALVQTGRNDEASKILQALDRDAPWTIARIIEPLVIQFVADHQPEAAIHWAASVNNIEDKFFILINLAQHLAKAKHTALATQVLTEVEQIAKRLQESPIPSAAAALSQSSTPFAIASPPATDPAQIEHTEAAYEALSRRHLQADYQIRLVPVYDALGQRQKAIAILQDSLKTAFAADAIHPWVGDSYEHLAEQTLDQYQKLVEPNQAIAKLTELYQASSQLPDSELKTRHLRSLAYGFAHLGLPDRALQLLPFQALPNRTQRPIILSLASQKQFDKAQQLAQQLQSGYGFYYDENHPLAIRAELTEALAIAGKTAQAQQVFTEIINYLLVDPDQSSVAWVQEWSQRYANQKLYALAQRLILVLYHPDFMHRDLAIVDYWDITFPLSSVSQSLIKAADIAIANGDPAEALKIIDAIPSRLDRARGLAQVSNTLSTMGHDDLANQSIETADDLVRSLPEHIGKAWVLLEINQAQIQLGYSEKTIHRLDQIMKLRITVTTQPVRWRAARATSL